MSLQPGDVLAQFRVVDSLGAGGMGEVWRATDTRLQREVAIKVLPPAFTADPERLARFEREAQLLAQLQHPNIASIFGIEEFEGHRALIMELVEGPTLAERLEQGALPLAEVLAIARQIAEALEEAHEKGIVHRDLKPQNVKAPEEGKVKVLDFGLAKAMDPVGESSGAGTASQLAASPTLTLGATVQGVILGTAAYMAPEQARGVGVDKRADIWAFGVVLYEMLAGRRMFEGELVTDVLANVLKQEVDHSALPPETPPPIRRLLRRCLERQPKKRLRDIGDARLVLDEVLAGVEDESPAVEVAAPAPAARPGWFVPAAAALAVGSGLALGWLARGAPEPPPVFEVSLAVPSELELDPIEHPSIAISSDGRRSVATVIDGGGQRWLLARELDAVATRLIVGTAGAQSPFFSPDGRSVGFFTGKSLARVAFEGGPVLELAEADISRGAVWSSDGYIYFSPSTGTALMRVPENGGPVTAVLELEADRSERTQRWPDALPDGSAVLFTSDTQETTEFYDDARIDAVRPETSERVTLLNGSSMARFLPPDRLLFARGGSLFATAFDARTLTVEGVPVPVLQQVLTDVPSGAVQVAVGAKGSALWIPGAAGSVSRFIARLDRTGQRLPLFLEPARYSSVAVSPDGRRLALAIDAERNANLWVADLENETLSRLTFEGTVSDLVWSPDGTRIAYALTGSGTEASDIYWKRADGSREAELLFSSPGEDYPTGFAPDGETLIFQHNEVGQRPDLWRLPISGPGAAGPLVDTPAAELLAELSPDGRWLAHVSTEDALGGIFVRDYPGATGLWQVNARGYEPHWSPDGRELYYRVLGVLRRVAISVRGAGIVAAAPETIVEGTVRGNLGSTYDLGPDGNLFVILEETEENAPRQINLSTGFRERVRQLTSPRR